MFGEGGGWGIPLAPYTLNVTLGGIAEKPGVMDGRIEICEYLSLAACRRETVAPQAGLMVN
jgi:hypothetical protein